MKKQLLILLVAINVFGFTYNTNANTTDSLMYEQQRQKINNMLNERSAKFGVYSESLQARTGIFGFKTKKDMQNSMDVLTDIIKTDNDILKETKTLLDYKNFEKEKIEVESKESKEKNLAYMRSINKLQNENEHVKQDLELAQAKIKSQKTKNIILITILIALVVFILGKFYSKKLQKS